CCWAALSVNESGLEWVGWLCRPPYWCAWYFVPPASGGAMSRVDPLLLRVKVPPSTGAPFPVSVTLPVGQVSWLTWKQAGDGGPVVPAAAELLVTYMRMI